ncbi:hypothetical protein Enr13x_09560 [Stieleria neptunia]|uniref:Uncharacterized protein n=1 Tax=Stieleria neptunia TaxID=2527979 RepID=A0A518HJU5_9BACT|nr:hypothetical protein [Stieleria neptunia]QDV41118.1 hypothetical protein Enr13x_09560 [Stieleria neptunia]
MDHQELETVVGYAVFDTFEECYEYNENACMIANSQENALAVMQRSFSAAEDCRIDAITFRDIMSDFGGSCGEYAMERHVYRTFKRIAELNNVTFTSEAYEGLETLLVVEVDGVKRRDD